MSKNKLLLVFLIMMFIAGAAFAAEAPDWVQMGYVEDDYNYLYAVSSGKGKTQQSSLMIAESLATANLNSMVDSMVTSQVEFYLNDSGIAESDNPDDAAAYYSLQIITEVFAKNELTGIRRKSFYKDEDGYYWVLMRMPKSNLEKVFDNAAEIATKEANINNTATYANSQREKAIAALKERVLKVADTDEIYDYQ